MINNKAFKDMPKPGSGGNAAVFTCPECGKSFVRTLPGQSKCSACLEKEKKAVDTKEVIAFFDRLAPEWDEGMIRNEEVIAKILDNADISEGKDILDVACGTGVLIPDYLSRNVNSVTGVDISPEMAKIAKNKFTDPKVEILCADIETIKLNKKFDGIMVYNAFPHFPDPERLIRTLSIMLKENGTLSIAHGMSREKLIQHHSGITQHVSEELMTIEELNEIMSRYLEVTVSVSDENMYQAVGVKR